MLSFLTMTWKKTQWFLVKDWCDKSLKKCCFRGSTENNSKTTILKTKHADMKFKKKLTETFTGELQGIRENLTFGCI